MKDFTKHTCLVLAVCFSVLAFGCDANAEPQNPETQTAALTREVPDLFLQDSLLIPFRQAFEYTYPYRDTGGCYKAGIWVGGDLWFQLELLNKFDDNAAQNEIEIHIFRCCFMLW